MAHIIYSASMSLDGFIAGPNGDVSWLTEYIGPDPAVDALMARIGALLIGGRSFRGDDPHRGDPEREKAFGGGWSGPQFVLTRTPPKEPVEGITFVTDFDAALSAAIEAAGDRSVNIIGANVARQCLDRGRLDEIVVFIAPVLLGDGTRLFERRPGGERVRLEPLGTTFTDRETCVRLRVVRDLGEPGALRRATR